MLRFILIFILSGLVGLNHAQAESTKFPFAHKTVGQGPDMVLIPGLASSSEVWKEAVDSLQHSFTCHLITLAGFAKETPIDVKDGFLPKVKASLIGYIKSECEGKAIIMGHSLGGFLSMGIASEAPELIEKVIIVDSYPFYSASMNPMATEASARAAADQFRQMLLATPDSQFAQQQQMTMAVLTTPPAKAQLALQWSLDSDRATIAQAMYEIMCTDLREEVGKINCPVLVFGSWYAAKDYGITKEMVKGVYETQFARTRDLKVQMAETGKHFIMWDEPQWFLTQVLTFVK